MTGAREKFVTILLLLSALFSAFVTISIFAFMMILGLPLMEGGRFFDLLFEPWDPYRGAYGIYPMVAGTAAIASLGIFFAFPLSLGCAALIAVLGLGKSGILLRRVVQLMTGVPTVIYGFVAIFLLVPLVRELFGRGSGMCILSASAMLAILVSPTMILFFSDSFRQVPKSYLHAADALGASPVQKLLYVILPCSRKGIVTGLVLGFGRALGDTLIALMIAGNAVSPPISLLDSARTLTAHIALVIAADYESLQFKSIFACGILLYVITTFLVVIMRSIETRGEQERP